MEAHVITAARPGRALPRYSFLRHLAWALVAAGCVQYTLLTGYMLEIDFRWLRPFADTVEDSGFGRLLPKPLVPPGPTLRNLTAVFTLFGPYLLSAVAAACRLRWWVPLTAGIVIGLIDAYASLNSWVSLPGHVVLVAAYWMVAGAYGGLLAWVRRWWRC